MIESGETVTNQADIEEQILNNVTLEKEKISKLPASNKTVLRALYEDEDGDAYLFIQCLKNRYVYDHITCSWYYWNDHFWRLDKINHVVTLVKEVIQLYGEQDIYETLTYQAAEKEGDDKKVQKHKTRSKHLKKRISDLRTITRKEKILKIARSGLNSLGITGEDWDKKPMLFACGNGCFDLQSGRFFDGDPCDYIKLVSPIKFEGEDAPRDLWENYLLQMYDQDQEIVAYIQRLLGYGITGLNTEHVFPIFWGKKGRNGKSTLFEVLKHVIGELAYKIPREFIMDKNIKGSGSGPDAVTTGMIGKRLVWFSETNEHERLDVAKLKEFSGGDTINARAPYAKRQIQFVLSALLLSLTNKVPRVPANDPGLWSRIHLIPHNNSFIDDPDPDNPHEFKADKNLLIKLKSQASGILMWLVEGALLWQEFGLLPPEKIIFATKEYQESQDIFGHFIKECCLTGESAYKEKPKDIYDKYKIWCMEVGHKCMAKNRVNNDLTERFGEKKKIDGYHYFRGIHLLDSLDF